MNSSLKGMTVESLPVQVEPAIPSPIEPRTRMRFIWLCRLAALSVIFLAALSGLYTKAAGIDFPQYYLGGKMVADGKWDDLYPVPVASSSENAGYPEASVMKPAYARRAVELGIGDTYRYAQPPPLAAMLSPLAMLPYRSARIAWLFLMALCLWGSCVVSGKIYRAITGRITRTEGVIIVVSSLLPRVFLSTRLGNISPLVGFLIATGTYSMLRDEQWRGALALVGGAVSKYSPLVVLPVALLRGQLQLFMRFMVGLLLIAIVTLPLSGIHPFVEFVSSIAPTQGRATFHWTNQTVWGVFSNFFFNDHLRDGLIRIALILQVASMVFIVFLLVRQRKRLLRPGPAVAAVLLLLCWLQIFGPVTWVHNAAYFVPFGGWLWYYSRTPALRGAMIALSALMFTPWASVRLPGNLNDPLTRFGFVGGMFALAIIAAIVLMRESPPREPAL
jgi:hypothetical protein